jgi:hypothetical protein
MRTTAATHASRNSDTFLSAISRSTLFLADPDQ